MDFFSKLQRYLDRKEGWEPPSYSNKSRQTRDYQNTQPRVINNNYFYTPSYRDPWYIRWNYFPYSGYNSFFYHPPTVIHHHYPSPTRSKDDSEKNDKEITAEKVFKGLVFAGALLSGGYYLINDGLNYLEERDLERELEEYQDSKPNLYRSMSQILRANTEHSKNMFLSKTVAIGSALALTANCFWFNDLSAMYLTIAIGTGSLFYGMWNHLLYQRRDTKTLVAIAKEELHKTIYPRRPETNPNASAPHRMYPDLESDETC